MTNILTDLSAERLAQAIENNGYAFTPFSHKWPGAEVHTGADLCWCITDIPFDWCNVVFRAHLKAEEVDVVIEDLVAKARQKKASLQWFTGRDSKPDNLGE